MTVASEFESWYGQVFSLLRVVQTGSGAHPASYPMDTGGSFPGGKAEHSPPASVEIKKFWIYTFITPYKAFNHENSVRIPRFPSRNDTPSHLGLLRLSDL
jgi:hypothetical protein